MGDAWFQAVCVAGWLLIAEFPWSASLLKGGSKPPLPRDRKLEARGLPESPADTSCLHRKQRCWAWAHWLLATAPAVVFSIIRLQNEGEM